MPVSSPKEEVRKTPAQWLKEGYVVRPNAEGKKVFYFKINEWITVYSKKEVTREKRAVEKYKAELKKKRNEKQKLYRLHKKYCEEVEEQRYHVIEVKFLTDEYDPERIYDFIARNEEEYNSIEIGAILQYADEQIEVVGKRYGRLLYNSYAEPTGKPVFPKDMKFYYNYKYLDGKRVDKPKRFVIPKDE